MRHTPIRRLLPFLAISLCLPVMACGRSDTSPARHGAPPYRMPELGIYVTNETSGDLTVIDAATLAPVATIPLGKRPRGLVASPDGRYLYVTLSGSPAAGPGVDEQSLPPPDRAADGIGVIDLRQGRLVQVLPSGPDPEQVAVSPDGTRVFIANEDAATASVLDVATGAVSHTYPVGGEPEGVSVEPGGGRVWVTSEQDGAVFVLDLAARTVVTSVAVGPRPRSVAFLPDGSRAYVPSENGASLTVIDVGRLRPIETIDLGKGMRPMGTVMSPDGLRLYVSTGRSRQVLVVDTSIQPGRRLD